MRSSEAQDLALAFPVDWQLAAAQKRSRGHFDRLPALDDGEGYVRRQKTQPRHTDQMTALDRVGGSSLSGQLFPRRPTPSDQSNEMRVAVGWPCIV